LVCCTEKNLATLYLHETHILCCATQNNVVRHKILSYDTNRKASNSQILSNNTSSCCTTQNSRFV
jgi:hypothetical protein